jgi:polysaccharide export outer membrane protein
MTLNRYLTSGGLMLALLAMACGYAGTARAATSDDYPRAATSDDYQIGPGDELAIWALGIDEAAGKRTVDHDGFIDMQMAGRVKAAGLTVQALRETLTDQLRTYVKDPEVTVSIVDYHSEPAAVIGAVKEPGVRDLRGGKRLVEVLALAGGLNPDAGNTIFVTRRKEWGTIPVPGKQPTDGGDSTTVEIPVNQLLQDGMSEYNIMIRPNDTISVPRARLVYVLGNVAKPGGFVLSERPGMSVLQALSLAGGMTRYAAASNAAILRSEPGSAKRREIAVNLHHIMDTRSGDVELKPDDILFVPNSNLKAASAKALEVGISITSGLIIWR